MRIKHKYSSNWRMILYGTFGCGAYLQYYHPNSLNYMKNHYFEQEGFYPMRSTYDEFKRREQWRWQEYMRKWDPYDYLSMAVESVGNVSSSVIDKLFFGTQKWQDPPSFDREANEFIKLAEASGIDAAQPVLDQITKVVDAYYPMDLDSDPESTKIIVEPKIQVIFDNDEFDKRVEEDENKPPAGSLGRYLWLIPGFQEYFESIRDLARKEEEELITSMDRDQRLVWYERMDELIKRMSHEWNDYGPLLANRWDRKLKLAQYLYSRDTEEKRNELESLLIEPGGVKQMFIQAGVITAEYDDYSSG